MAYSNPHNYPHQYRGSGGDGNGFVFIDHLGQICPSGFPPLACGDVRRDSLVRPYREHELFQRLRDPDALEGNCRAGEFRRTCGGSRARAYASTGSPFGPIRCACISRGRSRGATPG